MPQHLNIDNERVFDKNKEKFDEITDEVKSSVAVPSRAYNQMLDDSEWLLVQDLLGGTRAMRDAAQRYLPQEKAENNTDYSKRLLRSFLFEGFNDNIDKLAAKPFARDVTIKGGDLPEQLQDIQSDVDGTGKKLTQFGKDLFIAGLKYGMAHILVDFPTMLPGASKEDEQQAGVRPVFVQIDPPDLIGWRIGDDGKLDQIRIQEKVLMPHGLFGELEVRRVRVFTKEIWQVWVEAIDSDGKKQWQLLDEDIHSFGEVPLYTYYAKQTGALIARSPILGMALLNQEHWVSASDQANILHFSRIPFIFGSGLTADEVKDGFTLAANRSWLTENEAARVAYVELEGKSIEAGQRSIDKLEEKMAVMGMQPLQENKNRTTATEKIISESKVQSSIQMWIRALEATMELVYKKSAQFMNLEIPEDFAVDIFNDFGVTFSTDEDLRNLGELRKDGEITQKTHLNEYKRRSTLAEDVDIDKEIEETKKEKLQVTGITNLDDPNKQLQQSAVVTTGVERT